MSPSPPTDRSNLPTPPPNVHPRGHAAPSRRKRSDRFWILLFAGILLTGLTASLLVARWVLLEIRQADPIPGIAITVDAGGAPKPDRTDHAARAFLQRRLRAAGFDRPDIGPLRVHVAFRKIGAHQYQDIDRVVEVDKVRLEITFYDAAGRRLRTCTHEPQMFRQERVQYEAKFELNEAAYARAVSEILHMQLPGPQIATASPTPAPKPQPLRPSVKRDGPAPVARPPDQISPPAHAEHAPARPGTPPLLVHFPFEGHGSRLHNAGLSGLTAQLHGTEQRVPGRLGQALRFDGRTHIDCGNLAQLERTMPFSISVWIRRSSDKGMKIVSRLDDRERGYDLALIRGTVWFQLLHQAPDNCLQVTSVPQTQRDRWHHVVATYDGSSRASGVTIYLDARPVEIRVRRDRLSRSIMSPGRLRVGKHSRAEYGDFAGSIDDVRIYQGVLSKRDVQYLYDLSD